MSFASAFRVPARRALSSTSTKRLGTQFRASSYRGFSTEAPPPPKQNFGLYAGLGAIAAGGAAYYLFNSSDSSKSLTAKSTTTQVTKFVPTKADYEKVCYHCAFVHCNKPLNRIVVRSTNASVKLLTRPVTTMVDISTSHVVAAFDN